MNYDSIMSKNVSQQLSEESYRVSNNENEEEITLLQHFENKIKMLRESVEVTKEYSSVCLQLHELSENEDTKILLLDEKHKVMELYLVLISEIDFINDESLLYLCLSLKVLCKEKKSQKYIGSHNSLLVFLICSIKSESLSYLVRRTCIESLICLSWNDSVQKLLADMNNFSSDVMQCILLDSSDLRPQFIQLLSNLARNANHTRQLLVAHSQLSLELLDTLVNIILYPNDHYENIIIPVSESKHVSYCMKKEEFTSLLQSNACSLISQIAYLPAGAEYLSDPRRAPLMAFLASLLLLGRDGRTSSSSLRHSAAVTLANLAGSEFCLEKLLLIEYKLIENVIMLLSQRHKEELVLADYERVVLIRLLWGLAALPRVKVMLVEDYGDCLLPILLGLIQGVQGGKQQRTASRVWAVRLLVSLAETSSLEVITTLLQSGVHEVLLNILERVCGVPKHKWDQDNHMQYALSFIMTLSPHAMSMGPLKKAKALEIIEPITINHSENGSEALKAMIITAFLVGRDENKTNILSARPDIITQIVDVLDRTLSGQHGPVLEGQSKPEYRFGTFRLHLLLRAICAISVSDTNKLQLMASGRLLHLLSREVIGRFLVNGEAILPPHDSIQPGVGGGDDVESAELAIETLLQLSFVTEVENEIDNTNAFTMDDENWLLESLDNLLCNSENSQYKKLSHEGIRTVICLRSRLAAFSEKKKRLRSSSDNINAKVPLLVPATSRLSSEVPSSHSQAHVMISYCWHADAKPEVVKELAACLRDTYGYDVWRDEEGSDLLSPMRGSTIEHMAKAVELARVVVVCVSRQYKESANCRMEAVYAHQRHLKNKLDIIYVMTQEHYSPQSTAETCDGWLGIMIAEDMWYPMYNKSMVAAAAKGIAQRINSNNDLFSSEINLAAPISIFRKKSCPENSLHVLKRAMSMDSVLTSIRNPAIIRKPSLIETGDVEYAGDVSSIVSSTTTIPLFGNQEDSLIKVRESGGHQRKEVYSSTGEKKDETEISSDILGEAYAVLLNPKNSICPSETGKLLSILGLSSGKDLAYLESEDVELISDYMKKIPSRRFLDFFHVNK